MALWKKRRRKCEGVERYDGPTLNPETAYFNVYTWDDGSITTIEFSRTGAHVEEYEGEPKLPDDEPREPLGEGQPPKKVQGAPKSPADAPKAPAAGGKPA